MPENKPANVITWCLRIMMTIVVVVVVHAHMGRQPWLGALAIFIVTVALAAGLLWRTERREAPPVPDEPSSFRDGRLLAGLVAFAFVLRIAWVAVAHTRPESDFQIYLDLAQHLRNDGQFGFPAPSAFRPPGWPFVLRLLLATELDPVWIGGLFQSVVHALILIPIFMWANEAAGRRAAITASLLFALWPSQIIGSSVLATEPLYTLFVTTSLFLCYRALNAARPYLLLVVSGVLMGAAAYVRVNALAFLPIIAILAFVAVPSRRRVWIGGFGLATVMSVAMLVPWGIRNAEVMGHFSLTTSNGGVTLMYGNCDNARGGYIAHERVPLPPVSADEFKRDREARRLAMAWIASHPGKFLLLMPRKIAALMGDEVDEVSYAMNTPEWKPWRRSVGIVCSMWYGTMIAALLLVAWRSYASLSLLPVAGALAAILGQHLLFHGQNRYHAPLLPALCVTLAVLWPQVALRRSGRTHENGAA